MGIGGVFACLANEGAQLLNVGIGVLLQPGGQGLVVRQQAIAPVFGLVQGQLFGGRAIALHLQRFFNGRHLVVGEFAHQLADELNLAALALEVGDALGFAQCIVQLFGQLQGRQQIAAQAHQLLAQHLQCRAFALEVGLAGLGRAFEFGLVLQVEFAAFGNEAAFHKIAFLGFA